MDLTEGFSEPVTKMAWALVKTVGIYMILPVVAAIILLAVLRVRGALFKVIVITVAIVGTFLFIFYGLPQLTISMTI